MYITDLSKVTGNIKLDLSTGGIETDYGPYASTLVKGKGALTSGKLAPVIDYAHNPTFDVNVLSTQEFMNGFLKPTSKETVAYIGSNDGSRNYFSISLFTACAFELSTTP
jgi:hypothetical protein